MTTTLSRFQDAYATMTVASYQPLILRWFSGWTVAQLPDLLVARMEKSARTDLANGLSTAVSLARARLVRELNFDGVDAPGPDRAAQPVDTSGYLLTERHSDPGIAGAPDARIVGGVLHRSPVVTRVPGGHGTADERAPSGRVATLPAAWNRRLGIGGAGPEQIKQRQLLAKRVIEAVTRVANTPTISIEEELRAALVDGAGRRIYEFLPRTGLTEALSPIGIAHFYRQLYFNAAEGVGPIEQAFTVAPFETLEVAYETTRRRIHEEQVEIGEEIVTETAREQRDLDEVSDKVSSMVERDFNVAMSASASGGIGVWSASGSASASFSSSSQRSREQTSRRLKEVTNRASERISKSYKLRTRDVQDVTSTTLTRRIIRNETEAPVSYGLRRVLRRVRVKVQDLGPRLVWQLYLRNPGAGLARSRFVHFRESAPLAVPDTPPGLPPRPSGGAESGSKTIALEWQANKWYATLSVAPGRDRRVTAISLDAISDMEGGGKDDNAPAPLPSDDFEVEWDQDAHVFFVRAQVDPGDSRAVSVSYTYRWEPMPHVLQEWEDQRAAAVAELTEEALNEQFERHKQLITARSAIPMRPANDLRREERYEVLSRLVAQLFDRGDDPSEPMPLEIEYVHRYFAIDGMFVYAHPSWWRPRYSPVSTSLERPSYEITDESAPAPMGSSLGWLIQLDGDTRRNEFLNSPWVRVCLPIRDGHERAAIDWLAAHVEGEVGYDPDKQPLNELLESFDEIRDAQDALGTSGPDYVTVDSTPGAPAEPLTPQAVYPVIDEFEVTVPTEGFVYDELKISGS